MTNLDVATRPHHRWLPAHGRWHRRWRAQRADLMEAGALASLVVVLVGFLARGGLADLGAPGGLSLAVGQLTGLVATDLLLIQLLLAARVPWVDRVYGMDRALKAHRVLGRVTVPLIVVHVGALVLAYAEQDGLPWATGWAVEPFRMLSGVPDMVTAAISLALLVAVSITSVRAARNRLGYERWHLVHLTAYAAVILALPHQLSDGTDIVGHPWQRAYWLGLYLLTAGSLLWWRALVPVARSVWHAPRVSAVVEEAPGVWSVTVHGRRLDRLRAQPGQFFTWRFVSRGLFLAGHPWSLSAAPTDTHLRITVRDLGGHSRLVGQLRPGVRVVFEGPYGAFTAERREHRHVTLIAAGIGITPVRALAEQLAHPSHSVPGDITVLYRADAADQLTLAEELEQLEDEGGVDVLRLVGPPVNGSWLPRQVSAGLNDGDALARLVPGIRSHDVYVCGPPRWMSLVHSSLKAAGVPARQVHDERFGW